MDGYGWVGRPRGLPTGAQGKKGGFTSVATCAIAMPVLFDSSPGDAHLAARRLMSYYEHAAGGKSQRFLANCHLSSSWAVWSQACQAYRSSGLLKVQKHAKRRRRRSARLLLRRWNGLASLHLLAVEVRTLASAHAARSTMRLFLTRMKAEVALSATLFALGLCSDRQRQRAGVRRWRGYTDDVATRAARRIWQQGRAGCQRRALRSWRAAAMDRSGGARLAALAASHLHAVGAFGARLKCMRRWSAAARLRVARDVRGHPLSHQRLSRALRVWFARALRRRRKADARAFDAMLPAVDAQIEIRRFIVSWHHRMRCAWRMWAQTAASRVWWRCRYYARRWRERCRLRRVVLALARQLQGILPLGLAILTWRHHASSVKEERRLLRRAEACRAMLAWRLAISHLGDIQQGRDVKALGERWATGRAWSAWSDGIARGMRRAAHIALCEELRIVYCSGRALLVWRRFQSVDPRTAGRSTDEALSHCVRQVHTAMCGRAVRAWLLHLRLRRGALALIELIQASRAKRCLNGWRRRTTAALHASSLSDVALRSGCARRREEGACADALSAMRRAARGSGLGQRTIAAAVAMHALLAQRRAMARLSEWRDEAASD